MQNPPRVIAAVFALCGFVVALACGLLAGNPGLTILWNGVLALIVCHVVGTFAGMILVRVGENHITAHKAAHPVPEIIPLALRRREEGAGSGGKNSTGREKM